MEHTQKLIDRCNAMLDEAAKVVDGVSQYQNTVSKYLKTPSVFFGHVFGSNAEHEACVDAECQTVGCIVRVYSDGRRRTQFEDGFRRISREQAEQDIVDAANK